MLILHTFKATFKHPHLSVHLIGLICWVMKTTWNQQNITTLQVKVRMDHNDLEVDAHHWPMIITCVQYLQFDSIFGKVTSRWLWRYGSRSKVIIHNTTFLGGEYLQPSMKRILQMEGKSLCGSLSHFGEAKSWTDCKVMSRLQSHEQIAKSSIKRIPLMEGNLLCGHHSLLDMESHEQITLKIWVEVKIVKDDTPLCGEYLCQVGEGSLQWKESYGMDMILLSHFWQSHKQLTLADNQVMGQDQKSLYTFSWWWILVPSMKSIPPL